MKKTCKANLPAMIFLFALLILWQAGAMGLDAAYILPSPTQILAKLWELRDVLFTVHLPATMLVTAIGLGISLVLGLALAVVMDESDLVRKMIYPIVVVSQTIPTTAIAPLFVLWFGYGIWSKMLVTGEDQLEANRDKYTRFLRACQKGFADMQADPEEALGLLLANQDEENFPLTESVERRSFDVLLPIMETADAPFLSQDVSVWQENIDWLQKVGMIDAAFDPAEVMVDLLAE